MLVSACSNGFEAAVVGKYGGEVHVLHYCSIIIILFVLYFHNICFTLYSKTVNFFRLILF